MFVYEIYDIDESHSILKTDDIEFKKRIIDILSPFKEGYRFMPTFRAGIWDGKVNFCNLDKDFNIKLPKGLVGYITNDLEEKGFKYTYVNSTILEDITLEEFNLFVDSLNLPFKPYDYQLEASFDIIREKRGVFKAATGSGKSLIIYIAISWLLEHSKKTILVVPTIALTLQMRDDFISYGLKNPDVIKVIGGDFKDKELSQNPVIISTWQSLQYMNETEFEIFDAIIVDEAHAAKAEALNGIIGNARNSQIKVGLTGTIPKPLVDRLYLLGTLGKVKHIINPQGLIERGLATPVTINLLYLNYDGQDRTYVQKNKLSYIEETNFICEHYNRNRKVSAITNKLISAGNGENVLTLFTKINHGLDLLKNAIFYKINNSNFEILDKINKRQIEDLTERWVHDRFVIYVTQEIEPSDIKKITKLLKGLLKLELIEEFINSIKSITDLDLYFIYGGVDGDARERARKILEENPKVKLYFKEKIISVYKHFNVPLSNGLLKEAYLITVDDDVSDEWILNN